MNGLAIPPLEQLTFFKGHDFIKGGLKMPVTFNTKAERALERLKVVQREIAKLCTIIKSEMTKAKEQLIDGAKFCGVPRPV